VPARYRAAFIGAERTLASHRGYDRGALQLAREFSRRLQAPLVHSTISRLLIELNRSLDHSQIFSPYALRLAPATRDELVGRYYLPYRDAIARRVAAALRRGHRVIHLSCHSFTPRLGGILRTTDIGLLFDSRRAGETAFCHRWQAALRSRDPRLRVRRNYPYRGSDDGLTTDLRRRFPERSYIGIELEVNQRFPRGDARRWNALRAALLTTLSETLRGL